jgi:hypothetical protein
VQKRWVRHFELGGESAFAEYAQEKSGLRWKQKFAKKINGNNF